MASSPSPPWPCPLRVSAFVHPSGQVGLRCIEEDIEAEFSRVKTSQPPLHRLESYAQVHFDPAHALPLSAMAFDVLPSPQLGIVAGTTLVRTGSSAFWHLVRPQLASAQPSSLGAAAAAPTHPHSPRSHPPHALLRLKPLVPVNTSLGVDDWLAEHHDIVTPVDDDGDCMLRSILWAIGIAPTSAALKQLRENMATEMEDPKTRKPYAAYDVEFWAERAQALRAPVLDGHYDSDPALRRLPFYAIKPDDPRIRQKRAKMFPHGVVPRGCAWNEFAKGCSEDYHIDEELLSEMSRLIHPSHRHHRHGG